MHFLTIKQCYLEREKKQLNSYNLKNIKKSVQIKKISDIGVRNNIKFQ